MKHLKNLILYLIILIVCINNTNVFSINKGLNIAFIGNLGSGKTQLRRTVVDKPFTSTRNPTLYSDCFSHSLRYNYSTLMCNLCDTSGNKKVKNNIITERLKDVNIAVITIDVSQGNGSSFQDIIEQSFDEWVKTVRNIQPHAYILLAVTKIDLPHNSNLLRSKCENLKGWYSRLDYIFISARDGINLGNSDNQNDFNNNFWGKIRTILRDENMFYSLPNWDNTRSFRGEADDSTKKCQIL